MRRFVLQAARVCVNGSRQLATVAAKPTRVLVTGALGQIGSELVGALRTRYGVDNVIASDIRAPPADYNPGPFEYLDVENGPELHRSAVNHRVDWIVHLASMLSAVGEKNPAAAMRLNSRGIENVMETARAQGVRVFTPSTIAAFGPTTPPVMTPDLTIMRPTTMYGVTKVYLELLGEYYARKFGVDFRSLRYPGIISNQGMPGGGTTDYAVEIYHEALKKGQFTCFLLPDTSLPMMYMPDCIGATIAMMEAPAAKLTQRVYNVTGCSFTPTQVAASIRKHMPWFTIDYKPDFRQAIADSWPRSLDHQQFCADIGWKPEFDLDAMTHDMLTALRPRYPVTRLVPNTTVKASPSTATQTGEETPPEDVRMAA